MNRLRQMIKEELLKEYSLKPIIQTSTMKVYKTIGQGDKFDGGISIVSDGKVVFLSASDAKSLSSGLKQYNIGK